MRSTALGGFAPTQTGPQETPLVGATLVDVETSVAVWTALGHQQAPFVGAALMAFRYAALAGFRPYQVRPQQPPLVGGTLEHQETH